jgi:hypothetical protein
MIMLLRFTSPRAKPLGEYAYFSITCSTLRRISSDTGAEPFITRETVETDTPLFRAICRIVTVVFIGFPPALR